MTSLLSATLVSVGSDAFRLPKELIVRAGAILLLALAGIRFAYDPAPLRRPRSAPVLLTLAVVGWAAITTISASNPRVSVESLIDTTAGAVIFVTAWAYARGRSSALALIVILPAFVNAALVFAQAANVWNPFHFAADTPNALRRIALLGNPDDVGMYMTPVAICALVLAVSARSWLPRLSWATAAVIAYAALFLSESLTAFAALGAGTLVLVLLLFGGKRALVAFGVVAVAGLTVPTVRLKIDSLFPRDETTLAEISRGRFHAFYAAVLMAREAPVFGVGPGGYAWEYFDYKLKVDERRPELRGASQANFGETHNDHLQLLAESGVPGYLLFLAAMAVFGAASFKRPPPDADPRHRFAHLVALPLAVALFVLAIGLFPLHIAAARLAFLLTAALSFAWRMPNDAAVA